MEKYVHELRVSYDKIKDVFMKGHKCDPTLGDEICPVEDEWFINDMAIDAICDNAMINITEK